MPGGFYGMKSMSSNAVQFDAESHTYRLNGRVLPSVTQVISAVLPTWQASEYYLQRGSAVHLACRYLDEGRLEWGSVDESIRGRVDAWRAFREWYGGVVESCELSLAHDLYQFAGTLDRAFVKDGSPVIVDIKSALTPQVAVQLGGYALLYERREGLLVDCCMAVELRDAGRFKAFWLRGRDLKDAKQTFLGALTVFNFCKKHKLARNP